MNKSLYVRVQPKSGQASFFRCAMLFTLAWSLVDVDNATAARLQSEQMLEVSETEPADFVGVTAGDSAETSTVGADAGTPAPAPDAVVAEEPAKAPAPAKKKAAK